MGTLKAESMKQDLLGTSRIANQVLELEEKMCASSDADPTVVVLEFQVGKSIDEVVLGESSPVRAKAVEDKMDTSNVGADDTLKKRKSFDNGDLLEEEKGVM